MRKNNYHKEEEMTSNPKHNSRRTENGRLWAGVIILIIGFAMLAPQLGWGHMFPRWLFSWPMWLIVIGLIIGGNSNFKNPSSYVLLILGGVFLMQRHYDYNIWKMILPGFIIGLGIYLIFHKKSSTPPISGKKSSDNWEDLYRYNEDSKSSYKVDAEEETSEQDEEYKADPRFTRPRKGLVDEEDFLSSTAIFSEEKKILTSNNLQGGEIVNIFGGSDINLMHADIQGPIVIDLFQLFAGTKIIVPAHWKVHSKVVSIFGEVDDRRFYQESVKTEKKIIYLKGTSIFGGVTIKSM